MKRPSRNPPRRRVRSSARRSAPQSTGATPTSPRTIRSVIRHLLGTDAPAKPPRWPPDVFAIASTLLRDTGSYIRVVESPHWPPYAAHPRRQSTRRMAVEEWDAHVGQTAKEWRRCCAEDRRNPPRAVVDAWRALLSKADQPIDRVNDDGSKIWPTLMMLAAYADAACGGVGVVNEPASSRIGKDWAIVNEAQALLYRQFAGQGPRGQGSRTPCTLCKTIDPSVVLVLPKMRTPQSGATIRSISHNLALVDARGVMTRWSVQQPMTQQRRLEDKLNLILVPHPRSIAVEQFVPSEIAFPQALPDYHRFFCYHPAAPRDLDGFLGRLRKLIDEARHLVGPINGMIFPELSLTSDEHRKVRAMVIDEEHLELLIAGIAERGGDGRHGRNVANLDWSTEIGNGQYAIVSAQQPKHHRWFLEQHQLKNYMLAGKLDPTLKWWESTRYEERQISFFSMRPWLTMSVLICEDLNRPDPVGDVVRAVGPNLVIALLMDGPQIARRWSARCAFTLNDDPGSSVLTLTSLGMCARSDQHKRPPYSEKDARTISFWTDGENTREIDLPPNASAVALTLTRQFREEYTLDGRSDGGAAGAVRLSQISPLFTPLGD